jgi:hypothetical protein
VKLLRSENGVPMHIETIREAIRRTPFVPFTLRLNDGRELHIPHPEYIALSRRNVYVVDAATDSGMFLEPVLIASLTPAEMPSAPQSGPVTGGNS